MMLIDDIATLRDALNEANEKISDLQGEFGEIRPSGMVKRTYSCCSDCGY